MASTVTLLLAGALLAIFGPGSLAFRAQPALTEMRQRLRFAGDVLATRVASAGSAPSGGLSGVALGLRTPCLLPYRVGHRRADPAGSCRIDALALIAGKAGTVAGVLRVPFLPGERTVELEAARCPTAATACGIAADTNVLFLPGGGQADLFRVEAVSPPSLTVAPASGTVARAYPAGTPVVAVDIDVFYLRDTDEGPQLMRYDGWESDLPLLDHVSRFEVAWFGSADPPRIRGDAGAEPRPTYGPEPPEAGVDLPGDDWGPGENCAFTRSDGALVPRLPPLAGIPLSNVALGPGVLTDGPWCPGAAAAGRVDADLFRVRRVRLVLEVEAAAASSRGADPRLFRRPGSGASPHTLAPDQQLTLDVVPRSLGGW